MPAHRPRLLDALFVAGFALLLVVGTATLAHGPGELPDTVEIRMRFSRFEPAVVRVPAGRPVTFVLRNDDPIAHEWLIGDEETHQRHRTGTEPAHGELPTEVSIPALTTLQTTITFDEPVSWHFICHLPGHEAYGMVGVLNAD